MSDEALEGEESSMASTAENVERSQNPMVQTLAWSQDVLVKTFRTWGEFYKPFVAAVTKSGPVEVDQIEELEAARAEAREATAWATEVERACALAWEELAAAEIARDEARAQLVAATERAKAQSDAERDRARAERDRAREETRAAKAEAKAARAAEAEAKQQLDAQRTKPSGVTTKARPAAAKTSKTPPHAPTEES